tara:strand:+ start:109 stop:492 length:384 start_codon:yes stop_codon:yes gene_type:complete
MGKLKEVGMKEQEEQNRIEKVEKQFRDSPLGTAITELEGHVESHLGDMFESLGLEVKDREAMMTNFIAASHAAGTIQRLVWEQMDYEAKQREAVETSKVEKVVKKAEKKEATKKNRSRGKTSMKKVD